MSRNNSWIQACYFNPILNMQNLFPFSLQKEKQYIPLHLPPKTSHSLICKTSTFGLEIITWTSHKICSKPEFIIKKIDPSFSSEKWRGVEAKD